MNKKKVSSNVFLALSIFVSAFSLPPVVAQTPIDVFFIAGQSNAGNIGEQNGVGTSDVGFNLDFARIGDRPQPVQLPMLSWMPILAVGTVGGRVAVTTSNHELSPRSFHYALLGSPTFILGDIDQNGAVAFFDIAPFIELLNSGNFQIEGDANEDGVVDFFDIEPFIEILLGG